MKSFWAMAGAVLQLVICTLAVVAFLILAVHGENVWKWIPALLLAIALMVFAVVDIREQRSK